LYCTLSGKLIAFFGFAKASFLERGVPSPFRWKPTRFAAVFIHALLPSPLTGFVDIGVEVEASDLPLADTDCFDDEKVGVIKCGDLDLLWFSLSIPAGDCKT